jgi:hypothetical protein
MKDQDYKIDLLIDVSMQKAFACINNVSAWWTGDFVGDSQKLNGEFTVRFGDVHVSTQKIIEHVGDNKVVWLVTNSRLNFIKQENEWTNTTISFKLSTRDGKTLIQFIHHGLVPDVECYDACTKGWDFYIKGSLFKFIADGKGNPG